MSDAKDIWRGAGGLGSHRSAGLLRAPCLHCGWCYREDWCACCREENGQVQVWIDPTEMRKRVIDLMDEALREQGGVGLEYRGMILMAVSNGILGLIGVRDE